MPSVKNRLASYVMIEAKTPLHYFRRVVEIMSLSDVLDRKIHQNYDKLRDGKLDTVYSGWSPVNVACCYCYVLNSYSQPCKWGLVVAITKTPETGERGDSDSRLTDRGCSILADRGYSRLADSICSRLAKSRCSKLADSGCRVGWRAGDTVFWRTADEVHWSLTDNCA